MSLFKNRSDAGMRLAAALADFKDQPQCLVLGLPRGGVVVAAEVARRLSLGLDICLVRKLGLPDAEEVAFGAIASGGVRVLNEDVVSHCHVTPEVIEAITIREQRELRRRELAYRPALPPISIAGKSIIVVDDGVATGATLRAALASLRGGGAARIVAAVPVSSVAGAGDVEPLTDRWVCLSMPQPFVGVGASYVDFRQVSDDEVRALLRAQQENPVTSVHR